MVTPSGGLPSDLKRLQRGGDLGSGQSSLDDTIDGSMARMMANALDAAETMCGQFINFPHVGWPRLRPRPFVACQPDKGGGSHDLCSTQTYSWVWGTVQSTW